MSYLALYRKYRPKSFDEVVGQDHITTTLCNQISKKQISHAYLFTGSRGTGKTSVAKLFAKAINCENFSNGECCGKCPACVALENANNLDVLEIDAASNNRVDEIRDIRENVKFLPVAGKYKVYIIDEVHMLTDSAFNALLKTLEEPPEHVVFILATTEVHKLPATILSRCIRFDFALVSVNILVELLKSILNKENITYEIDALKSIAVAGEGSVRDTLSIADCVSAYANKNITLKSVTEVLGISDKQVILDFTKAIITKNVGDGLEIINSVVNQGKNISMFAKDLTCHFRDLLVIKTCKEPNSILLLPEDLYKKYEAQAETTQVNDLANYMQIYSSIEAELKYALSPRTLVETAFVASVSDEGVKKN